MDRCACLTVRGPVPGIRGAGLATDSSTISRSRARSNGFGRSRELPPRKSLLSRGHVRRDTATEAPRSAGRRSRPELLPAHVRQVEVQEDQVGRVIAGEREAQASLHRRDELMPGRARSSARRASGWPGCPRCTGRFGFEDRLRRPAGGRRPERPRAASSAEARSTRGALATELLETSIVPPIASTSGLVSARPRPVPSIAASRYRAARTARRAGHALRRDPLTGVRTRIRSCPGRRRRDRNGAVLAVVLDAVRDRFSSTCLRRWCRPPRMTRRSPPLALSRRRRPPAWREA